MKPLDYTTVFSIIAVNFLISEVTSICCPDVEQILYDPAPDATCDNITGAYHWADGICAYKTCADLEDHKDRHYCGVGDCNIFGCNCDGGCIQLDEFSTLLVSMVEQRTNRPVNLRDIFKIRYNNYIDKIYKMYSEKVSSNVAIGN